MTEEWLFVDTGDQSAAFNMAFDEALLNWVHQGKLKPILRFYGWKPAGLSLGYFQKTKNRINIDAAKSHGFDIVRRPTGGLAVLHDNELTYSVVISEAHEKMPSSITAAYKVLSMGLLEGYRKLNLQASLAEPKNIPGKSGTAVCFEEPSWYELVVDGRKAAGSAQTRQKGVILQHGSIPLEIDDEVLFHLFEFPNERIRERARKAFGDKAVAINQVAQSPFSLTEVKQAFKEGFEKGLDITLTPYEPDKELLEEARQLALEKYNNPEYNFSR
ncbi:lipoate-protein ligase A [Pullulanibacillus pueri]|uniref:Octanoyltransferase LipM n=1 Tax=Pullulanibacillus pueri TaxID=1437324 RepID=A0A8J2ZWX3_9BACL|nr:biotin/lipoate A/B protein ligase family protein [Pullulanibacillus pueri]MBM7682878.1 lipoate-protein ligase A [Pullulanibacillus pueri]GGH84365.1 octanoyltransferase LipM [Pullulanibacillus pueri]